MWAEPRCTLEAMGNPAASPRTRRAAVVAGVLVMLAALLSGCTGGKDAVDQNGSDFHYVQGTKVGSLIAASKRKKAGDVVGPLVGNPGSYQLSQSRGKVVVLNFFASWCGPCKVESPQFETVYQARKDKGVQFVGLDVKDTKSAVADFISEKGLTYPIVFDELGKTAIQLGKIPLSGLPSTVIVDKQGRVAAVYTVAVLPKDIDPVLDTLTAES